MVYHLHYPLSEIAGLDDIQLAEVFFRRRDKYGSLKKKRRRKGPYIKTPVSFKEMYWSVKRVQGMDEKDIEGAWQNYLFENPSLVEYLKGQGQWP